MELAIDYNTFKTEINNFINQAKKVNLKNPKTQEELNQFIEEKKTWEKVCSTYLEGSFKGDKNEFFADAFLETKSFDFGYTLPIEQLAKNVKNNLIEKINNLEYCLKLLDISDMFINPKLVEKEGRKKWSVQQKKNLLLKKLDELNDGLYHDVSYILWSNGIEIKSHDEPRQLATSLKEYRYVDVIGSIGGLSARITIQGTEYLESIIEEEGQQKSTATKKDIETINERLDEVVDWLKKNDMGNEIIFDEIQELKDAGKKLDLKNWQQLVKGKLYDLATAKVVGISMEGLREVLNTLTGEDLTKMLK